MQPAGHFTDAFIKRMWCKESLLFPQAMPNRLPGAGNQTSLIGPDRHVSDLDVESSRCRVPLLLIFFNAMAILHMPMSAYKTTGRGVLLKLTG